MQQKVDIDISKGEPVNFDRVSIGALVYLKNNEKVMIGNITEYDGKKLAINSILTNNRSKYTSDLYLGRVIVDIPFKDEYSLCYINKLIVE